MATSRLEDTSFLPPGVTWVPPIAPREFKGRRNTLFVFGTVFGIVEAIWGAVLVFGYFRYGHTFDWGSFWFFQGLSVITGAVMALFVGYVFFYANTWFGLSPHGVHVVARNRTRVVPWTAIRALEFTSTDSGEAGRIEKWTLHYWDEQMRREREVGFFEPQDRHWVIAMVDDPHFPRVPMKKEWWSRLGREPPLGWPIT